MSHDNVETVIRFIEVVADAEATDNWERLFAELDPDVAIDDHDISLDTEPYQGHDGVRRWLGVWNDAWESWRVEELDVRPVGEDRVLAEFLMSAQGKGSGIELSRRDAVVCRLRAGKIVEIGYYNDQQQAREALRLQEPP